MHLSSWHLEVLRFLVRISPVQKWNASSNHKKCQVDAIQIGRGSVEARVSCHHHSLSLSRAKLGLGRQRWSGCWPGCWHLLFMGFLSFLPVLKKGKKCSVLEVSDGVQLQVVAWIEKCVSQFELEFSHPSWWLARNWECFQPKSVQLNCWGSWDP